MCLNPCYNGNGHDERLEKLRAVGMGLNPCYNGNGHDFQRGELLGDRRLRVLILVITEMVMTPCWHWSEYCEKG